MYWYIPVAILVVIIVVGIPTLDYILTIKEYKEKNKMSKKTVLDMLVDGWCEGCDCDPAQCQAAGRCLAEEDDTNDEEKSV